MSGRIGPEYEIVRELRRGPWVTVYEARHRVLGRRTLVKWLNPEHIGDEELTGRLRREARLGAAVDHPNAARLYGVGEAEDRPYVAIEWIEGEDLENLLKRSKTLPIPKTIRLARDLLAGLNAIHNAGVVHRDLSQTNVRITEDGLARITDFGLATGKYDPRYTLPGTI
ncbi:serine/threonine protein kinase, partial [bacterium]|nr:serine/threonine protein kinase [bacterium]